ncbi:hydantoinase B/oxoprolinase family protein [Bradyrhizobium sp. KB893862 SZCCT0404]|uniref:hydantoinase B/oxoprolinase family protein n=1 Tax=Bradyrhizobium sp. KB893862 SZCCT0404 TaxID=2807672 RepID=UPI001BAE12E6|nr:hydantoinase B/oxoprolinase family protein [Bradyrhizobium sp. KB893862 SZCCT0404]MBR1175201.1 hydantoinase B/oxoprolinase family protein [Bradyrhizobium sp. KB893862 SZCCT0404]
MSEIAIDPISLEIAWNGLKSIADECFISIMRSAFSTNVKERHDHSTAIADAQGRLVVQAEMALPIHLASMRGLMDFILKRYGSDIHPGDVFIANDPHVAGGTHLPDINMAMPVFEGTRLIGFVANIIHHADVGGAAVGSMSGGLDEIYKEGLRIPIIRLYSKGVLNEDLLTLLLLNMRLEEERRGDLNAQIAACKLGVSRLEDMLREHGGDRISTIFSEVIARTEMRMRKAIASLPDGVYSFTDFMDDDGAGTEDIKIALKIEKKDDRILFDFEGSDPQVRGNFNMVFNATQSAVCFALKALLDPNVPNNHGIFDAIEIKAPLGSFVNCVAPAAVALRANSCQRVVDCVFGALAEQVPDRVVAGTNGANTSAVFAGTDPRTGQLYVYLETLGGGMGARATFDGKDGVQVNITNTSNLPVEAIELEYPLRVEEYSLIEDTGGAGRFRGGLGIRRTIRPIGHACEFNGVGERFVHKPWGLFGGEDGATGRFYIRSDDGQVKELAAKACCIRLRPNDVAVLETAGAGGYGPAAERRPEAVREDLASGKFSDEYVKQHYPGGA